jgi:hypothetical protein
MEYKRFDTDLIERTRDIIRELSDKTDKEVTLLINCLYGLVIIPTEKRYNDNLYDEYKKYCQDKIMEFGFIRKNDDSDRLFRSIRNALAHKRIRVENQNGKIAKIILSDKKTNNADPHTIVEFTVDELKQYALDVADYYLELLERDSQS